MIRIGKSLDHEMMFTIYVVGSCLVAILSDPFVGDGIGEGLPSGILGLWAAAWRICVITGG